MSGAPLGGSVDDWLAWQLTLHATEMELGLERVARVGDALGVRNSRFQTIVVAGTNGKGSCAALIENLLRDGHCVGTYTSPHLWRYNERFRIDGTPVTDDVLCAAFRAVEAARGETTLTFFEYGTLAALWLFAEHAVDVAVLEVGLGGRLDAVNIVDADVALITNIGLDHVDWLGDDRESIGFEKAGVLRANRPAVCADRAMPQSIARTAQRLGTPLARIGRDFDIRLDPDRWRFTAGETRRDLAPANGVLADNLAAALATVHALTSRWPDAATIDAACRAQARLPGRREYIDGDVPILYDVGHNLEAMEMLVRDLMARPVNGITHIVLGMLADKPVEKIAPLLEKCGDWFYFASLDGIGTRGLSAARLAARTGLRGTGYANPSAGRDAALSAARPGDRVVVCGSFLTVAHARKASS